MARATDRGYLGQLRRILCRRLTVRDLRVLCFDLEVDYDDLEGSTKTGKVMDLLGYLHSRQELERQLSTSQARLENVRAQQVSLGDTATVTEKRIRELASTHERWEREAAGARQYLAQYDTEVENLAAECDQATAAERGVRGERETRKQILIYTFVLVGVTLLLPLINATGTVYLVSAIALGLWLIYAAWQVWVVPGNKVAWKMYRYSSMYLAFIFLALMVDAVV